MTEWTHPDRKQESEGLTSHFVFALMLVNHLLDVFVLQEQDFIKHMLQHLKHFGARPHINNTGVMLENLDRCAESLTRTFISGAAL